MPDSTAGSSRTPERRGLKPFTSCIHCESRKSIEASANIEPNAARMPPVKVRSANSRTLSRGSAALRQRRTKSARSAMPALNASARVSSSRGAGASSPAAMCLSAQTVSTMPSNESTAAAGSQGPFFTTLISGSTAMPATSTRPMSGMFTRKAECQLKRSTRNPPSTGPTAMPAPPTMDQAATATTHSTASRKMLRTAEIVVGMMRAAATPITARTPMTPGALRAARTSAEPMQNTRAPIRKVRFRPMRSDRELAATSSPARTRE